MFIHTPDTREISFLIALRINAFNDAGAPLTMTNHIRRPI